MHCFGITNHSPDQALRFLTTKKVIKDSSEVAIVPSGTILKEGKKPVRPILFILTVMDFYRNVEVLNSKKYEGAQVFVFASPLRIRELANIVPLDFEVNAATAGLGFILKKELDLNAYRKGCKVDAQEVKRKTAEYLTMLTDNVKRGSLLNPLMTFLYTLPSATHQTPVKEAVAMYLYKGKSFEKLEEMLDGIKGVIISKRVRDKLKEILKSEVGENYRAAFKAFRESKDDGKTPALQAICKKFGTSDYEMKYLRSIVEAATANKPSRGKTIAAAAQKQPVAA
jgi:hypothetical protein